MGEGREGGTEDIAKPGYSVMYSQNDSSQISSNLCNSFTRFNLFHHNNRSGSYTFSKLSSALNKKKFKKSNKGEHAPLVEFMCPVFTRMPGGITVGDSGL